MGRTHSQQVRRAERRRDRLPDHFAQRCYPWQHEKIMGLKGKFGIVCEHAEYARTHTDGKVDILIKAVRMT